MLKRAAGNEGEYLELFSTNLTSTKNGKNNGHLYPVFQDRHTTAGAMYIANN